MKSVWFVLCLLERISQSFKKGAEVLHEEALNAYRLTTFFPVYKTQFNGYLGVGGNSL